MRRGRGVPAYAPGQPEHKVSAGYLPPMNMTERSTGTPDLRFPGDAGVAIADIVGDCALVTGYARVKKG